MRVSFLVALYIFTSVGVYAQTILSNNNTIITMSSSKDVLFVKGTYVSNGNAEIRSNGTVYITDSLVNKSKTGQVFAESGKENVVFSGNRTGYIKGLKNSKIQNLTINKTGKDLVLLDTLMVRQRIELVSGNIELKSGNLDMGNFSTSNSSSFRDTIMGEMANKRIFGTGGALRVKRNATGVVNKFGGVGLEVQAASGSLGEVIVERRHSSLPVSDGSIFRSFTILPSFSALLSSLKFNYLDPEIQGQNEATLSVWQKSNTAKTWNKAASTINAASNSLTSNTLFLTNAPTTFTAATASCTTFKPKIAWTQDTARLCEKDTLTLDAQNKGSVYVWSDNDTVQAKKITKEGLVWVKLTSPRGCEASDSIFVDTLTKPIANFLVNPLYCKGVAVKPITTSVPLSMPSYSWDFGDKVSNDFSVSVSPTYTYQDTGAVFIRLKVTAENGCMDSLRKSVNIRPFPKASFTSSAICNDSTFQFSNTSTVAGKDGLVFKWLYGDGTTSTTKNPTKYFSTAGSYTVKLVVTSSAGCVDSIQNTIFNKYDSYGCPSSGQSPPGSNTSCTDINAGFLVSSKVIVGDSLYFAHISQPEANETIWDFGDGITSNQYNPVHVFGYSNTFYVKLIVRNTNCYDTLVKKIEVKNVSARKDLTHEDGAISFLEIKDFKAYPNPNSNFIWLELSLSRTDQITAQIIGVDGRVLWQKQLEGERILEQIPTNEFAQGMYHLQIKTSNESKVQKFVKL